MLERNFNNLDMWTEKSGPMQKVVASSRVRYARNLAKYTYAPYAKSEELEKIADEIHQAIMSSKILKNYERISITDLSSLERVYLKESRLISSEMEKGGQFRLVYLSKDRDISIMVNEEDHIRMQNIVPGFQLSKITEEMNRIDDDIGEKLDYAFSPNLGHLTTCPTNTGTGFRASAMMHLPGLALSKSTDLVLKTLQPFGLTVRGFYGENSDFSGDFYQISNEVSLGKSEEQILDIMKRVIIQIAEKEQETREKLFVKNTSQIEDTVWRSYALLSNARMINSSEAMQHLSHLRLGIDRKLFPSFTHTELNNLVMKIQPAHLQIKQPGEINPQARDIARAKFLRKSISGIISNN